MNYKDCTTLKTAGKVAFKKIAATDTHKAYTVLEKKTYDVNTGEESTSQIQMSLAELEQEKAFKTAEKEALQKEITEIGKMITQIKKV